MNVIIKVALTRRGELVGEVLEKLVPGKISHWPKQHHRSNEARVPQNYTLVGREFAHAVGEHHVVPVILIYNKIVDIIIQNSHFC